MVKIVLILIQINLVWK